ncbi:MAG: hypothetical protein ACR2G5_18875 [Pyrinomonadaceae bacterium]
MSFSKSYFKNEAIWNLIFNFGPLLGVLLVVLLVVLVMRLLR